VSKRFDADRPDRQPGVGIVVRLSGQGELVPGGPNERPGIADLRPVAPIGGRETMMNEMLPSLS
jgi:hypothetical protein